MACALTISPVLVELSPSHRIASITVANPGDRAVTLQAQTLAWTQPDGIDRYAESNDLIVVPPIATIEAGGTQIFRLTMRAPPSPQEQAYRLVLEDVTEPGAEPQPASKDPTINIHVNHMLPVFFSSVGKRVLQQPRLGSCTNTATAGAAPRGCVQLDNDGNRYVAVRSMAIDGANVHLEFKGNSRVLIGAWRQWVFALPPHFTGPLHATAETSAGPIKFEWRVPER